MLGVRVGRNLGIKAQEMEVFKGGIGEIVRKKVRVATVRSQVRRGRIRSVYLARVYVRATDFVISRYGVSKHRYFHLR